MIATANMADNEKMKVASAAFIVLSGILKKKKQNKRRWWMTKIFKNRNRYSGSDLMCDLSIEDFQILIELVGPKIQKRDTNFRECIPCKERLAITLRFLATGDSFTSLSYLFKVSKQSISTIVNEVCKALVETLKDHIYVS